MELSESRKEVIQKIDQYEKAGIFDRDVENDPPTRPLTPGEVDYTYKKLSSRISAGIANRVAVNHFEKKLKNREFVIKEVRGKENLSAIQNCGAMITCNHFNAFDNYAVYKALKPAIGKRKLYKVIREGNYTSFGGLYGYFFRHCNTLPLSSNIKVLGELSDGVSKLLARGEKILIYPEQAMWWNYKKPRPLKSGAFQFAARACVPVLPIFITLEDTEKVLEDRSFAQAYTIHILPPIFPDTRKNARANAREMCISNYHAWKEVYENFYKIPLEYTTEGEVPPCCT